MIVFLLSCKDAPCVSVKKNVSAKNKKVLMFLIIRCVLDFTLFCISRERFYGTINGEKTFNSEEKFDYFETLLTLNSDHRVCLFTLAGVHLMYEVTFA